MAINPDDLLIDLQLTDPITVVYAYLLIDPVTGREGIPAMLLGGKWFPMITGRKTLAEGAMRRGAESIARRTGKTLTFVQFTAREVLGTVGGN